MPRKIVTENHVKALVKEWFDTQQAWSYAPIQNGLGVHGIPDRIGCVPIAVTRAMVGKKIGLFVAVEAKRPGREKENNRGMTKHQAANFEAIERAGGIAEVCDGEADLFELYVSMALIYGGPR
jgi:hypothetical protein